MGKIPVDSGFAQNFSFPLSRFPLLDLRSAINLWISPPHAATEGRTPAV
jgi:hypothetical protein